MSHRETLRWRLQQQHSQLSCQRRDHWRLRFLKRTNQSGRFRMWQGWWRWSRPWGLSCSQIFSRSHCDIFINIICYLMTSLTWWWSPWDRWIRETPRSRASLRPCQEGDIPRRWSWGRRWENASCSHSKSRFQDYPRSLFLKNYKFNVWHYFYLWLDLGSIRSILRDGLSTPYFIDW